jgi:cytochrome P450
MAFGAGPRQCVGELFALRRLFYIITHTLQTFTLEPDLDVDGLVTCDPRAYEFGLILTPNSFRVRLIERA